MKVTYVKFNFLQKLSESVSLSTPGVELGGSDDLHVSNIITHRNEKVHIMAELCKKYPSYRKMLHIKIVQN